MFQFLNLLFTTWDVSPELISIGAFTARWYGFLFGLGFIVGYYIMAYFYKNENKDIKEVDKLFVFVIFGGVMGARLGHCLFYEFDYTMNNPLYILYIWEGGLASHGGAIGTFLAIFIFSRIKKTSYIWLFDRIVIPALLLSSLVRVGNFFNSEIIGLPSNLPWAVLFKQNPLYNDVPRHPTQIYEAIMYLICFLSLLYLYVKKRPLLKPGQLLGIFLTVVFSLRFFIEFFKENQESFESNYLLNMGQILSIPFIIIGLVFMFKTCLKRGS